MPTEALLEISRPARRKVAKILLADSDLASRLTLKSLLSKAGYAVEGAASAAEAMSRLDAHEFQLVLADLRAESATAGQALLAFARQKAYRPATALVTSDMTGPSTWRDADRVVSVTNEDVSNFLANIAELIGNRADRRMRSRVA
ncbi:MAG TPA: response regulator [Bryobacteraceae bacterium]|nr:response regulator [Bryobacteraceae bacterium]